MKVIGRIPIVGTDRAKFRIAALVCTAALLISACAAIAQVRVDSPYSNDAPGRLLRGQLHCHSIQDINRNAQHSVEPARLAEQYRDCGFDFVALTDHYRISSSLESCCVTWAAYSIETTPDPFAQGLPHRWPNQPHVLAIGMDPEVKCKDLWRGVRYFDKPVNSIKQRAKNIHMRHGLALVAHPDDKGWQGLRYNNFSVNARQLRDLYLLDPVYRPDGVSVYNSGGKGHSSEAKWDCLLAMGGGKIKAWGFSEEDYHPRQNYTMGKAWVAAPGSPGESWEVIEDKLRSGNYYAYWVEGGGWPGSWPVPGLRVSVQDSGRNPEIEARIEDEMGQPCSVDSIRFIGCIGGYPGKTLREVSGSGARYVCRGTEVYVRVRVTHRVAGLTLNITSQPLFVSRESGSSRPDG